MFNSKYPLQLFKKLSKLVFYSSESKSVIEKCEQYLSLNVCDEALKFPYVWLRDNCQCPKCFHPNARSRIFDWKNFNLNVKPKEVTLEDDTVKILWDDNHISNYSIKWLQFRNFTSYNRKVYKQTIYQPDKITWDGRDFDTICSKHDYNDLLNSNQALYSFLEKLCVYGVTMVENVPNNELAIDGIVEKIAFNKQTHYGKKFIVQNVPNTSNVAYLSSNLQIHTDLPYYEYCPGVNMLHCFVQTTSLGGFNILSDGFFTAEFMKCNHPEPYEILKDTNVEWSDIGIESNNEFFKLYRSPVICDREGEVVRVNFSVPQRGSYLLADVCNVQAWYEAHRLFLDLNHNFCAKFKMCPGNILAFDNIRLLHGRTAYEDSNDNVRKLIGAYLDWDEVYSRLRCIKIKLGYIDRHLL